MTPRRPSPIAALAAAALLGIVAVASLAPATGAESTDPALNETDMDTTVPPADEGYLNDSADANATPMTNDTSAGADATPDPTLTEDDFDIGVPAADESFLTDEGLDGNDTAAPATQQDPAPTTPKGTQVPGIPVPGLLAALALGALASAHASRRRQ